MIKREEIGLKIQMLLRNCQTTLL